MTHFEILPAKSYNDKLGDFLFRATRFVRRLKTTCNPLVSGALKIMEFIPLVSCVHKIIRLR